MQVRNMTSASGRSVANQYIISHYDGDHVEIFQSYDSTIAEKRYITGSDEIEISLDGAYWDYSITTGKYRNQFLGETKKETQAKIDSGEYKLTSLN